MSEAYRKLVDERMLRNWWFDYGEAAVARQRGPVRVRVRGRDDRRRDRPDRADARRAAPGSPTSRPASADNAPKAEESLQLGIYYLAVKESDDLADLPAGAPVELALPEGRLEGATTGSSSDVAIDARDEEPYQAAVRETLAGLIARSRS